MCKGGGQIFSGGKPGLVYFIMGRKREKKLFGFFVGQKEKEKKKRRGGKERPLGKPGVVPFAP